MVQRLPSEGCDCGHGVETTMDFFFVVAYGPVLGFLQACDCDYVDLCHEDFARGYGYGFAGLCVTDNLPFLPYAGQGVGDF